MAGEQQLIFVSSFAAGEEGGIRAYHLDQTTGSLTATERFGELEHPFFLALSPSAAQLYSIHAPGQFGGENDEFVVALEIVDSRGSLREVNRQSSRGTASCYLDVSPDGKTVVVANYLSGSVASYAVEKNGGLSSPKSFVQHQGGSVNLQRQQGPHAHCIVFSPSGRHVFAADLGKDTVQNYRRDGHQLVPSQQPFVRSAPGAGPRHLTFHPDGKRVYVVNELANTVTSFLYDEATGYLAEQQTISTLPDGFSEVTHTADVKVTPDGKFLYATNRGHDSIACYRVGEGGQFSRIAIVPSLGKGPQNLAIVAEGRFLLCANMPGNNLSVFRIAADGRLSPVGDPIAVKMPSCIMPVRAPKNGN